MMNGGSVVEEAAFSYRMCASYILHPAYLCSWWLAGVCLLLAITVISSSWLFRSAGKRAGRAAGDDNQYRKKVPALPPGSMGLPLGLGENLQFAFRNSCPIGSPPPYLASKLRKYGTIFKTHLMGCPTVVSMDPDLNKLLLCNEEKLVQVDFPNVVKKIIGPMLKIHGARHRRIRELATSIVSPAAIRARHLIPVQEHARASLRSWCGMPLVDAQQESRKFHFSYFIKILIRLQPDDPTTELLMRDFLVLEKGYTVVPVDLPGTTYNKVLKARKRILGILSKLLQARRETYIREEPEDFLDAIQNETDECGKPFSEQDIVNFIFFFSVAGFQTTGVFLLNVIKFLSENGCVVDELRSEHLRIRENKKADEMLSWDDVQQMHFTELVMKETLRLSSILHFVTREALHDVVFKDMVIPKGWKIFMNFLMVHLDPRYFKDPLKFDPWRWKDTENNRQSLLMPFGGGLRSCLGSSFAKFEVSVFLHYLLTTYKWERIIKDGGQLDMVSMASFPTMEKGLISKVEPLNTVH